MVYINSAVQVFQYPRELLVIIFSGLCKPPTQQRCSGTNVGACALAQVLEELHCNVDVNFGFVLFEWDRVHLINLK
jgi:hypothetical protein